MSDATGGSPPRWQGANDPVAERQHRWADGYVVDTPYLEPVVADLCPAWLSMASVLHGQPPLDLQGPLTWLDLGTGSGLSACMVGAANPNVDVWGFDHNPAHVERARSVAARAGLANCTFEERTFAALAADDTVGPSQADVIVVHGVYSWISAENQAQVAKVIEQRLRPGGLAYIMYESPTGWSSMVPVTEALRLLAHADGRRGDLAFPDAAAAVQALANAGARTFPLAPREAKQMESWATANPFYAAHEYLGSHFAPLMFDEVAATMADARCSFLGAIDATDHLPAYWAPPELAPLVVDIVDPTMREMVRDLITQRPLRRDLFRRGMAVVSSQEWERWVRDLRIVGTGAPFTDAPVDLLAGGVALDPGFYEPLVGALGDLAGSPPLGVDEIREIHTEWSVADAASALAMLVAGGYAVPALPGGPTAAAVASAQAMNELIIAENRSGADHASLVTPTTGAAIGTEFVELLAIGAVWAGAAPVVSSLADHVVEELARQGRTIREDGELVHDPAAVRPIVERRVAGALGKVERTLPRLGVFGPS